ncbi:dihydropteroate synthase [Rhodopirellula sp. SWK7]|uniref:dihydropteroate synthase n=1 Tax=Rhodopirellula sp. SWK7 TaxID=595460 RepID=UPI0002BF7BB4|nr:dihydropteroate synthase [Rhodopirellula sp. SWK7]EMI40369.1 dihydropteroate synthase [Rhodopirellula sp. SWK7]
MSPSLIWKTSRRTISLGNRPRIMGILNVTPDSFSDGGKFFEPSDFEPSNLGLGSIEPNSEHERLRIDAAVAAGLQMQADGADILDIGGESTRPYSTPVNAATEIARVAPVIERLAPQLKIPISIDTSKADVARAAIEAGAEIINDVTGLEGDPEMTDLAKRTGVGVCVMHMQGNPQTMQDAPTYENVVEEIRDYLIARRDACLSSGIELEKICLDPGVGFGKTHEHNFELIQGIHRFTDLGCACLIGHSRKGFIRKRLAPLVEASGREFNPMAGTLGVSLAATAAGAHLIRVHDVAETVEAIEMFQACQRTSRA